MNTPAPSFFNGSSSFFILLQVTRTCIKAWLSLKFDQSPPPTTELAAELASLEHLKKSMYSVVNTLASLFLAHLSRRLMVSL